MAACIAGSLAGCVFLLPPESRPPSLTGAPGAPRPDGCGLEAYASQGAPPAGTQDIGTVSAVAMTRGSCVEHLTRHEACHYGADVLYGVESGVSSLGQETPTVWCTARIARKQAAPTASR
jgi:hypothetical protein